jgi:hypothetical protein
MRNPFTSSVDTVHLVDAEGLVGCPRAQRDVAASSCLTCAELLLAVRSADGQLVEIRCTPPSRTVRTPWDLLLSPR